MDTLIFCENTKFDSDLKSIVRTCIIDSFISDRLTKANLAGLQDILNSELKTKIFTSLEVVTGTTIKIQSINTKFYLMEWHFATPEALAKIESTLNYLEDGIIYRTIAPYACKWIKCSRKLYVLTYTLNDNSKHLIKNILDCIQKNIN